MGASGAGTTTLGKSLSIELGYSLFDTDDYYWVPSKPPFVTARELDERIEMMKTDLDNCDQWILSGSLCGWGDVFIPRFDLVIYLWIPKDLRLKRLTEREKQRYGEKQILEGGSMYQSHKKFMEWAGNYDEGDLNIRSKMLHKQWISRLECEVLELEGDLTINERIEAVLQYMKKRKLQ